MNFKLFSIFLLLVINTFAFISCETKDDTPVKCFTDQDCIKAGLKNSYCRKPKKIIKIHHSECAPRLGNFFDINFIFCFVYCTRFIIFIDASLKKMNSMKLLV